MTEPTNYPPAQRSTGGRVITIVASALVALFALGFLVAGGALLWIDGKKDEQGYITSGAERFATDTAAIATSGLDVDLDGAESIVGPDSYGKLRLKVAAQGDKPVFVGIARRSNVTTYLSGTAHTTLTDVDYSPFHADYRDARGNRDAAPPSTQRIWAASTVGSGTQTLDWDVDEGNWSIVVMNADGSPGVDVDVRAGAKVPHLAGFGWVSIGTGTALVVIAGGLLFVGLRGPRRPANGLGTPAEAVLTTAG